MQINLRFTSSDHLEPTTTTGTRTDATDTDTTTVTPDDVTRRKSLLHEKLLELDCFVDETDVWNFEHVVQQSMIDPTATTYLHTTATCNSDPQHDDDAMEGSDHCNIPLKTNGIQKYGKSTIKTCQTYYYPKKNNQHGSLETMKIAAARTARQIEFLYQRHKAQQTQWIRNHDSPLPSSSPLSFISQQHHTTTNANMCRLPVPKFYYPFVVVLDNLRSAQNVGSIYRTADATKCQQVITIGITPNPCNGNGLHKVQKSSLGAELYVPTQHFVNATMALQYIEHTYPSYQMVCVETTSESIPYTDLHYEHTYYSSSSSTGSDGTSTHDNGMVFIFGNEVTGVDVSFYLSQIAKQNHHPPYIRNDGDENRSEVMGYNDNKNSSMTVSNVLPSQSPCTTSTLPLPIQHTQPRKKVLQMIEIPMYGTKNSLNVAVCVSIILYEMIRQYNTNTKSSNVAIGSGTRDYDK
jgi:tRNA G18 (ribose-2'-O)-methylase SpoU